MSVIRLWGSLDTHGLTPAQTRAAFLQAIHDAIVVAEQQGRLERLVADQLRLALTERRP